MKDPLAQEGKIVTAVRLPKHLHQDLKKTAYERGTSVTHLLVRAAERFLADLPPLAPREFPKQLSK